MSNRNTIVDVEISSLDGNPTCGQLQDAADDNSLFPDECGAIQTQTLATSDLCGCKDFDGSDCAPPGFTNTQTCNLCDSTNQRIGDPDRIIPTGILTGTKCITAFDDNAYGAFNSVCGKAQSLIQKWCSCVNPGVFHKQCLAVEKDTDICNPRDDSDVCCAGSCKYLNSKGGYRCTERSGDTPPVAPAPVGAFCFSGDMQVTTAEEGSIAMKDLKIGDKVLTGANEFETVYSFGHRHETTKAIYLQIHTDQSNALELSADHMVFIQKNHAVPAASLKEGNTLLLPDGQLTTIQRIQKVTRYGAYAPFTFSGSVVVNGIVASSYVSFQEKSEYLRLSESVSTRLTFQWLAHVFEAPHRLAYRLGFFNEKYTTSGVSQWVDLPHKFGKWLMQQNGAIMSLFVLPALAIFGFIWCLEQNLITAVVLVGLLLVARSKSFTKARRIQFTC
jgi:hypothetical protein